ncbi:MAG: NADH-quinone oxidoreductase subunit NuoK [Acidobacteriota bacterium]|nr:NADH-quinone oxidoreductase subunit NuoK [Acidobacteriota bacterium]
MIVIPLTAFLLAGVVLFAIGLYTILAQRSAVMVLMGIELVLNAVGLNAVAFWRFVAPRDYSGQIFAILIVTVGAIEMAVGLGIAMLLYRRRQTVRVDDYEQLKG